MNSVIQKFSGTPAKFAGARGVTVNLLATFGDNLVTSDTLQLDRMRQNVQNGLEARGWSVAYCSVIPFDGGYVYAVVLGLNVDSVYPATDIRSRLISDLQDYTALRNVNITLLNDPQTYSYTGSTGTTASGTYTVISGDTLNAIARRFGMTLAQILALNPQITNANVISVGQVIRVSGSVSPVSNPSSTSTATPVGNDLSAILAAIQGINKPTTADTSGKNWFDRTFFNGAGALTGVGIGVLVVLGAVVVTKSR